MTCEQFEPWIAAYQDGALDERRRCLVDEHLAICEACQALREELAQLDCALRAELTHVEAPETLHMRVMAALPEPESVPTTRRGSPPPRGWLAFGLAPIGALATWLLMTSTPTPLVAPAARFLGSLAGPPRIVIPFSAITPGPSARSNPPNGQPGDPRTPAQRGATGGPNDRRRPGASSGPTAERNAYQEALERLRKIRQGRLRGLIVADPAGGDGSGGQPSETSGTGSGSSASGSPSDRSSSHSLATYPGPYGSIPEEAVPQPITVVDYVLPMVQPRAPKGEAGPGSLRGLSVTQAVFEY